MRILKIFSALLNYPDAALQEAAPELAAMLAEEAVLTATERCVLIELVEEIGAADLLDLQERYVALFDQTRSLSLYLFEHVHGESRDRGQAMVDLRALFERHGLAMESGELPDHLPLVLEFLSLVPQTEARALLADIQPIAETLATRLEKRKLPQAAMLRVLVRLGGEAPAVEVAHAASPPEDAAALDAAWEEQPVHFVQAVNLAAAGLKGG